MGTETLTESTADQVLTAEERQNLLEIDSCLFGFIQLDDGDQPKRRLLEKGIIYYQQKIQEHAILLTKDSSKGKDPAIANIYRELGHVHLLLEQYSKALSAYQKYYYSNQETWKSFDCGHAGAPPLVEQIDPRTYSL
uniref:Uncharacterized protein n=1 Tax=Octopus bimaculoides TaxID=37653 RepID=A0A0L8FIN7_OCTBM